MISSSFDVTDALNREIAGQAIDRINAISGNMRVRFDGFTTEEAYALFGEIGSVFDDLDRRGVVRVVDNALAYAGGISVDDAANFRNRPDVSLALLVPLGNADGVKTLGESVFNIFTYQELIESVAEVVLAELLTSLDSKKLQGYLKELHLKRGLSPDKNWVEFLLSIRNQPSEAGLGLNLWRIGMVPDLGSDAGTRLMQNHEISKRLSAPPLPSSTLSARIAGLGLRDRALAWSLESHLSEIDTTDAVAWTKMLYEKGPATLTFENWITLDDTRVEITSLSISKFRDANGKPRRYSKLAIVEGSEVFSAVVARGADGDWHGKVGVEWSTVPINNVGVHSWLVEVVPPASVRESSPDWIPLGSVSAKASSRKSLVSFSISDEEFIPGTRLICRVSGLDASNTVVALVPATEVALGPEACVAESEEFQIGEQATGLDSPSGREASVVSFPIAALEEARGGASDWASICDDVKVDQYDGLAEITSSRGKKYSISFSRPISLLQHEAITEPGACFSFAGVLDFDSRLDVSLLRRTPNELPAAFLTARKRFFKALKTQSPEGWAAIEFALWDSKMVELAQTYASAYKRLLETADPDTLSRALALDVVNLEFKTENGLKVPVTITLPIHPVRALWWAQYSRAVFEAAEKTVDLPFGDRQSINRRFFNDVSPRHYPFAQYSEQESLFAYWGELTFGVAIHGSVEYQNVDELCHSLRKACGVNSRGNSRGLADSVVTRLQDFSRLHAGKQGLSLKFLNDANGNLAHSVMRAFLRPKLDDPSSLHDFVSHRVEIYGSNGEFGKPSEALIALQREYSDLSFRGRHTYLVPPLSLAMQPVASLDSSHVHADVSVISSYENREFTEADLNQSSIPFQNGLVTRLEVKQSVDGSAVLIMPTVGSSRTREMGGLAQAHKAYLNALASNVGLGDKGIGLRVNVDADDARMLHSLHEKSEWVVSLEQNGGVHLFEQVLDDSLNPKIFILDYSVEGVDATGDRITVTSSDSAAVDEAISVAMQDLNLVAAGRSPAEVLRTLSQISGRLALRLRESTNRAKEIVGLASVVMHLRLGQKLNETLLIPVDEHPEIFHPSLRGGGGSGRRCDLLLARFKSPGRLELEFIEVKFRSATEATSQVLFNDVTSQLITTRQFVKKEVLAVTGERPDETWHWSRFCSLLHFYADKSLSNGTLTGAQAKEMKVLIDKVYERREEPKYSASGYIVSTDAVVSEGDRSLNGVVVKYLAANMLNHLGLTTASFGPEVVDAT